MSLRIKRRDHQTRTLCAIVIAIVVVCAGRATAQTLTLVWDPSTDPSVVGYRVHVGTTAGVYTETFDVGLVTSFAYNAVEPRIYYLAVAAYAAGPQVGPPSAPVSGFPGASGADPPETSAFYAQLWRGGPRPARAAGNRDVSGAAPPPVCWAGVMTDCLTVRSVARLTEPVTGITEARDGRLFIVEGGRRVRVIAGALQKTTALEISGSITRMGPLDLDPTFDRTGLVYVGETETRPNGEREFRVVRYRAIRNQLAGRVVVASIQIAGTGEAMFALTPERRLYISVPGSASDDIACAGTILRLNLDSTLPPDHRDGSPVVSSGLAYPTAITFDRRNGRLWLAGSDAAGRQLLGSLDDQMVTEGLEVELKVSPVPGPLTSLSTLKAFPAGGVMAVSADGGLEAAQLDHSGAVAGISRLLLQSLRPTRVLVSEHSSGLFVTVGGAGDQSEIFHLTPAR
jgi:hypothetical protein